MIRVVCPGNGRWIPPADDGGCVEGVHTLLNESNNLTTIPVFTTRAAAEAYLREKGLVTYPKETNIDSQARKVPSVSVWREASLHFYLQRQQHVDHLGVY